MRLLRKMVFCTIFCLVWVLGIWGCEELLRQGDKTAQAVKDISAPADQFMQSPTGQALPGQVKLYVAGGIALASVLANGWQEWRSQQMKKTTRAIVQGIESAPENITTGTIKESIGNQMKIAGCYDRGRKIVKKLKIS